MTELRTCTKCGEEKATTTEYFYKSRHQTGGLSTRCRACKKLYEIETKEQRKEWVRKNKDKINRQQRVRFANRTPEQKAEAARRRTELYYANHEESKKRFREYRARHADEINQKRRERRKNDPAYRTKVRESHYTPRGRWFDIRNSAVNKRDIVWELPFEYYEKEIWGKNCHYCGELNTSNGVDRVDNNRGYTIGNIVPSCHPCNARKSVVSYEVYLNRINGVDIEEYNRLNNIMKECTVCGESKLHVSENFYRNSVKSFDTYSYKTFQSQCKNCYGARDKAYYQANKESIAKREKAYKAANKEMIAKRNKAYYQANKESIAKREKAYYEANKEKIIKRGKEYRARKKLLDNQYNICYSKNIT